MVKFMLKMALICLMGLTIAVSSLSAFKPKELYRDQVAVLMYHHVHDQDRSSGTVTTRLFRDQLSYMKSKGYHFISLTEFKHFLEGSPVPANAALVTFDDGYESFYQYAYPVLKELQIPAVNFIITGTVDQPDSGNIPFMNREQLAALAQEKGFIDIECHTDAMHDKVDGKALLTHRTVKDDREETDEEYHDRIVSDMTLCRNKLQEISAGSGDALAYPFGIYNDAAVKAVKEGGIQYAFTILPKMATRQSDPLRIPRINAGSPYIRPEGLHNMIMRRVSAVKHPHDNVPLRETVEQIGGDLYTDKQTGELVIRFNGAQYLVSGDRGSVTDLSRGTVITLQHPIKAAGSRLYIDLNELQRVLNVPIYFDSNTKTYTTEPPIQSDTEIDMMKNAVKG